MKKITPKLLAAALAAAAFAAHSQTIVYTAEEFQTALTDAANNGASDSVIQLSSALDPAGGSSTLGYYKGNFIYNSVAGVGLTVEAIGPGPITIDGVGLGRALNITGTTTTTGAGDPGNITVSGITFVRNCGSYQIGTLRIAGGTGSTITVSDCQFLSRSTNGGMGVEITSGDKAYIENCAIIGKTSSNTGGGANYDGDGISISGVTDTTLISGSTISYNFQGLGANITSSAVLNVFSNVFQGNSQGGLYFDPSPGSKIAQVLAVTNVFSSNGIPYGGANFINFNTLVLATNLFEGNASGGGLAVETGVNAATVANTFVGNTGGAAVFTQLLSNGVSGNTFIGNSGNSYGGAYFVNNTSNLITGNTFSGNISMIGGAGAVDCASGSYHSLSNNTFTANQAKNGSGGAVQVVGGNGASFVTLSGNTFTGNSCIGNYTGGALSISGISNLITLNTFELNSSADGGGAIADTAPAMTLTDNLLVQNSQSGGAATGGALYLIPSSSLYMINNTITSNTSAGGGGGTALLPTGTGNFYLYNNIIFGNATTGGSGYDVYLGGTGSTCIVSNNDINDISGVYYGHNNANADPKFYDPINGDYHLQCCASPASPCLATGDAQAQALPLTDLDGNPRVDGSGNVDMGCYELNTTAFHPADTAQAYTITGDEFNAYSNAWKMGIPWSIDPNPVPANYLTRAGYLNLNDTSTYHNDGSDRPTNWKPTTRGP